MSSKEKSKKKRGGENSLKKPNKKVRKNAILNQSVEKSNRKIFLKENKFCQ